MTASAEHCQLPLYAFNTTLAFMISPNEASNHNIFLPCPFFALVPHNLKKKNHQGQVGTRKQNKKNPTKLTQPAKGFGAGPFRV